MRTILKVLIRLQQLNLSELFIRLVVAFGTFLFFHAISTLILNLLSLKIMLIGVFIASFIISYLVYSLTFKK